MCYCRKSKWAGNLFFSFSKREFKCLLVQVKVEKHESKELDYLDNIFKINSAVYNLHKHQVASKKQSSYLVNSYIRNLEKEKNYKLRKKLDCKWTHITNDVSVCSLKTHCNGKIGVHFSLKPFRMENSN